MSFTEFQKTVNLSKQRIYSEAFAQYRQSIRVKKEMTAVKNLSRIFDATLRISNKKGFPSMTMRDLSRETGLSMGALYTCFSSKEDLLEMLQRQGRLIVDRFLKQATEAETEPRAKLNGAVKTHLYLSEAMQPWFYFSYMEAKNLTKKQAKMAVDSELYTEQVFLDILNEGQERGVFVPRDYRLMASLIKAMVQDWYLKRRKYAKRQVSVDQYADFVLALVEAFCLAPQEVTTLNQEE